MSKVKIKVKKLVKHARIPTKSKSYKIGYDIFACDSGYKNQDFSYVEYGTGLVLDVQPGYIAVIVPKYKISDTPHFLANSIDVIEPHNKNEVKLRFRTDENKEWLEYNFGDAIGILYVLPTFEAEFEEIKEDPTTAFTSSELCENIDFDEETDG